MKALVRYMLIDLLRSNRYFMPAVAYGIFILWIYSLRPNPVLESYSVTVAVLYPVAIWLGVLLSGVEAPRQQELTILHAGGCGKYAAARAVLLSLLGLVFTLWAVLIPVIMGSFDRAATAADIALAVLSHEMAFVLGSGLSWLLVILFRKPKTASGVTMVAAALGLASGGVADMLPDWGSWLGWLLPPVYRIMRALSGFENMDAGTIFLHFGVSFLYICLLYALIIRRFGILRA
jgi:hypothetical protein